MKQITTFLMFDGKAEQAMNFYVSLFADSAIKSILSQDGQVLMPLGAYPFSKKYAWINDKFGVSWQLMLAGA
ncbi:MAG: VOC family protein [Chloroflexi bacterium]|nr:VOC family protein [Chloroflexota bacterium]